MSATPGQTVTPLHCPQCGYSLAGLPDDHRCPECGFGYQREAITAIAYGEAYAQRGLYGQIGLLSLVSVVLVTLPGFTRSHDQVELFSKLGFLAICAGIAFRKWRGHDSEHDELGMTVAQFTWVILLVFSFLAPELLQFAAVVSIVVAVGVALRHTPRYPFLLRSIDKRVVERLRWWRYLAFVSFAIAVVFNLATI